MKKKKLDKKTLAQFREKLIARRGLITRTLEELSKPDGDHRSVVSDDISSSAQNSEQDEINWQLAEVESEELAEIHEALTRIDAGKFGLCETCDSTIALIRLNALPYALRCLDCQKKHEQNRHVPEYRPEIERD